VNLAYRLGALGFLAHPDLTRESGYGGSGNYGLMDLIGDPAATTKERGLRDLFALATYAMSTSFVPRAEVHRFTLATGDERSLGTEVDVVAPLALPAGTSLELGFSLFRNGPAAAALGLGTEDTNRRWFYAQLRAGF